MRAFLPSALLALSATALAQTPTYISPVLAATAFGNVNNTIPFVSPTGVHYQQVHSASSWTQTGGIINRLRSRQVRGGLGYIGGNADIELFLAWSPNSAENASATFANNVTPGSETNVFVRKMYKIPDLVANDTSWAAGDFLFDAPFLWAPNTHISWRTAIYTNDATAYTLDCFSDWRNGTSSPYAGCAHALGTGTALHNNTYRSPGNVSEFLGYPRLATLIPGMPTILLLGASNGSWSGIPLPFDLGPVGAPGCQIVNDALIMIGAAWTASTFVQINVTFPSDQSLVGARYFSQFLFLEAGANALGLWTSNGRINGPIPAPVGITRIYAYGAPTATAGTLGPQFAIPIGLN